MLQSSAPAAADTVEILAHVSSAITTLARVYADGGICRAASDSRFCSALRQHLRELRVQLYHALDVLADVEHRAGHTVDRVIAMAKTVAASAESCVGGGARFEWPDDGRDIVRDVISRIRSAYAAACDAELELHAASVLVFPLRRSVPGQIRFVPAF